MSEQNKTVVRRLFEELWNKGNLPVADELIAPTYTHHDAATPDVGRGPDREKKRVTLYRNALHRLSIDGRGHDCRRRNSGGSLVVPWRSQG